MIVFIDDEKEILDVYLQYMSLEMPERLCFTFSNPIEGIDFIVKHKQLISVVVVDQNMTPMRGIEVIKSLRLLDVDCKFIINTGCENPVDSMDLIYFEGILNGSHKTVFSEKCYSIVEKIREILKDG